jgi:hypothetical protein
MPILKGIVIAASLTASTAVFAGPAQLSDAQYLAAARCQGLLTSSALGKQDVSAINAFMASQERGRMPQVIDRADEVRADAVRQASHAGPNGKAELISERDGACQVWTHPDTATASRVN